MKEAAVSLVSIIPIQSFSTLRLIHRCSDNYQFITVHTLWKPITTFWLLVSSEHVNFGLIRK